jgi:hypothetical protein
VDVGAAAPELFGLECRPFLPRLKWRRLVWCVALGPVCYVWCDSVLASACGLGTGVDAGAAVRKLFSLEYHPFLLGLKWRRLVWCAALGPVCSIVLYGFR